MNKIFKRLDSKNKTASRLAETNITNFSVVLAAFGVICASGAFLLANTSGYEHNSFWQAVLLVTAFLDFVPIVIEIYDDNN